MADTVQAELSTSVPAVIRLNGDALAWPQIPKPVKAKLRDLRRARHDARLAWRAVSDERAEAWDNKRSIEARLTALTGGRPSSPWYGHAQQANYYRLEDDHPEVGEQLTKLNDAKAIIERLDRLVEVRAHHMDQLSRLLNSLETYLGEGLAAVADAIKIYKGPAPSPQKRETPTDAVERCRRRLRELDADRHKVASAPWHSAQAKERARAEIDALAARGKPDVMSLVESQAELIYWRERPFSDVIIAGRLVSASGDPSALPLLFWLHRDAIVAKIEAQINEVADDANALTAEQRTEQIGEIERDRLAVQREEEYWIGKAIDVGMTILRRPDADPRAVLGLADDMPAPVNA